MPRHPEHIDAFAAFLQNYALSARIMRHITATLQDGVLYDYVQGELWLIAARIGRTSELVKLLDTAKVQCCAKTSPVLDAPWLGRFFYELPQRRHL